MKYFSVVLFALLVTSCAKEETTDKGNENLPIVLSATFSTASSTQSRATDTAFEAGDELGLFVVKSGMEVQMEGNLVNNHKMVVGDDGVIKGTPTAVYYPTQSVSLYSYYPYQSGDATADALGVLVGIRTDQTDFSYLKRSDLCYGSVHDIAPSKAAQSLSFKHSFAQVRVNVTLFTGCPSIKQLRLINIKDSATLNMQSGALTLKSHTAEVLTYPNSANSPTSFTAIIPAQTLAGACVAIDLVDPTDPSGLDKGETYIYNAVTPINLAQASTNTLNLAVNEKGVITITGYPTISAWGNNSNSGNISESVNNQISLYWLAPHADYATADKITLTTTDQLGVIRDIDLTPTVDPASSADYAVYKLNLTLSGTTYPLIVNRIKIYKATNLLSDCSDVTLVGKVLYKSGPHVLAIDTNRVWVKINNLIWATGNLVADGENDARVGAPDDAGLYFHFGSLVGWTGGANGDGTGQGSPTLGQKVTPVGYSGSNSWPAGYTTSGDVSSTDNASTGVGDPCRYYLKDGWRLPTNTEFYNLYSNVVNGTAWGSCPTGAWSASPAGAWGGAGAKSANASTSIFFPVSGRRNYNDGSFSNVGSGGFCWSSVQQNSYSGYNLSFNSSNVYPQNFNDRASGFPVRCVKDAPTEPQPPTADQIVTINGLKWTKGNLVANGRQNAKVGAPGDGGLYFQYGGLIGYKGGATGDGTGICNAATHPDGKWWGGAAAYSANDVAVTPAGYASKATWPYFDNVASGGFGYYYFSTFNKRYADFQSQANANNPTLGIGDPCAHYLGSTWRLPTYVELSAITGSTTENAWVPWSTAGVTGKWSNSGPQSAKGAWFGPNSRTGTPTSNTDLFIPASGCRSYDNGSFRVVGIEGLLWSSSACDYRSGFDLYINESTGVTPRRWYNRAYGFPVRCVSN